jgi:hypothetical protein
MKIMRKCALRCSLLVAAFAAPANAQLTNFELDNYPTSTRSAPPGSSSWRSNPNVTPGSTGCYYVPGRFNTANGDAVLSVAPGGVIYRLLTSIGQSYTHSGMALGSSSIRHNTMDERSIDTVDAFIIPQYLKPTGTKSLRDGWPGVMTHTVEAAATWREFNLLDGLVLYSFSPTGFPDSVAQTSFRADQRAAAGSQMRAFRGHYRLYAYTDMNWRDPFTLAGDDGNMCSGSIYHANARAGNMGWAPSVWVSYSADVRNGAAQTLYSAVRSDVKNGTAFPEIALLWLNELFGGTSLDDIATRAANQVVNCMAFNDCGNRGSRWRNGVGTGTSMSPQDLYNLAALYAFVSAWAGVDSGFVYNGAKPLEATGNYYCCTQTDSSGTTRLNSCSFQ